MKTTLFEKIMMYVNCAWIIFMVACMMVDQDHPWMESPLRHYITGGILLPIIASFTTRLFKNNSKEFLYGCASFMLVVAGIFGPIAYVVIFVLSSVLSPSMLTTETMKKILTDYAIGALITFVFLIALKKINNKLRAIKEMTQFKEGWISASAVIAEVITASGISAGICVLLFVVLVLVG